MSLSACGGQSGDENVAPSPTPTESPEATPEQLASVIAGKEAEWREVIDAALDCRFDWTLADPADAAEVNGITCYLRELTIGYTAATAIDDLANLTPPASMESLVTATNEALTTIRDIDLEAACGEPVSLPDRSEACTSALGLRSSAYTNLESVLDQWGPYQ